MDNEMEANKPTNDEKQKVFNKDTKKKSIIQ
jgi:hypothetical protein